jgi:tRNA 2-selenouridine synthase
VIEDESRTIGKCTLPARLFARMQNAPMIVIECTRSARAANLISTYINKNYLLRDGDKFDSTTEGKFLQFASDLNANLKAIEVRLGGAEFKVIGAMVIDAVHEHRETGAFTAHLPWVDRLLERYYDPVYDRHLQRELHRVVFRGDTASARSFLRQANL